MATTREVPLKPGECALLIIDMQEYCAVPGKGLFANVDPNNIGEEHSYFFDRLKNTTIPALQNLLKAFRAKKSQADVIYTYIECLTEDGRDQSLDYKLHDFMVPKGSPDAKILKDIEPVGDEILLPKTSCSVFNSTTIEYILHNLGKLKFFNNVTFKFESLYLGKDNHPDYS